MQLTPLTLFNSLSDMTRLHIVLLLKQCEELCVCDLVIALNVSQPKISRHLSILRQSGLLSDRRDGKWIHYRLSIYLPLWANIIIEQAYLCQRQEIERLAIPVSDCER